MTEPTPPIPIGWPVNSVDLMAEALWRFELSDGLKDVLWSEECPEDRAYYREMAAAAMAAVA